MDIDAATRTRIADRSHRSISSVNRAYAGVKLASTTRRSIEQAARELGLPLPPAAPAAPKAA